MEFGVPEEAEALFAEIDSFIAREIEPLEEDHPEFFDHRLEDARTDWSDGTPSAEWQALKEEMRDLADEAGLYRLALPERYGGRDCDPVVRAMAREHVARRGPGLSQVLGTRGQSIVGSFPHVLAIDRFGTDAQRERYVEDLIAGETTMSIGMTEPDHGSDVTHMETTAVREGEEWVIDGDKRFMAGWPIADVIRVVARTAGEPGDRDGLTAFLVPADAAGVETSFYFWTWNMPTAHAEISLSDVRVPRDAVLGTEGTALTQALDFVQRGRLRQAANALGYAQFCIDESVAFARERSTWGTPLSHRQAVQFPLAELETEAEMVRNLLYKTAWLTGTAEPAAIHRYVAMVNYKANELACRAADQAIQVHGGLGYTRHEPFTRIYAQFRRYRISEGTEEIQKRTIAGDMFDFR